MPGITVCIGRSAIARQRHHDVRRSVSSVVRRYNPSRNSLKFAVLSAGFVLAGLCTFAAPARDAFARDIDDHSAIAAVLPPAGAAGGGLVVSTANVAVDKGDTLDRLLAAQGVPADNRRAVLDALGDMMDPAGLQAGSRLRLTFAPAGGTAGATRLVQTIELMTGDTTSLTVHIDAPRQVSDQDLAEALHAHAGAGKASIWVAHQQQDNQGASGQKPAEQQAAAGGGADRAPTADLTPAEDGQFIVQHMTGMVGRNLRASLIAKDLPAALADEIVLGFKAGSGPSSAPHATATFEVIYEGVQRDGKLEEPQLRYAMLDDNGKTRRIYRYQTDDQTTTLMQEDGHGVALVDLGKPLQIDARITSPYGWRIHPVFGDRRFHEGVDFGAPTGTPVVATSDGVVEDIGWRGNYGKYIRLRHDGHLATAYAHLSGFARGLQRGSTVKRGDVIAYVGRTGVATGPHLYYEVLVDGKQIDPMKSPPAVPVSLAGQQLAEFQRYVGATPEE
jgi:murein DD-endopeptidase MepM/ murein hydrolase activator NlpD